MARRLKQARSDNIDGFDISRFENSEAISKDLLCIICMNVPKDPQMHGVQGCDHLFCASCLTTWLQENNTCPACRQALSASSPAYRIVQSMLNDLRIACDNARSGCKHVMRLEELKAHLKECPKAQIRCPDCSQSMLRDQLETHSAVCEERLIECENCQMKVAASQIQQHIASACPKARMTCECGRQVRRMDLSKHQVGDCPETEVTCSIPQCGFRVKRKDLNHHFEVASVQHVNLLSTQLALLSSVVLHGASDEQKAMLQQWKGNPTMGTNAYVWSVCLSPEKLADLRTLAANGEDRRVEPIHSPPCYESNGYCFELLLYPNGNSRENAGHFALFWGLIPGVNDERLAWPCFFQQVELKVGAHRYTVQVSSESRSRPAVGKKGHHRGIGKMCPLREMSEIVQNGIIEVYVRIA